MVEDSPLFLAPLQTGFEGFSHLAELASRLDLYKFSVIDLDLHLTTWCDANLCSPLGALLYRASRNLNEIRVVNAVNQVEKTLCRNGFLVNYGHAPCLDRYQNTIQYQRFEPGDIHTFSGYLNEQLRGKAIPKMSAQLTRRFFEGLEEIFENASTHADSALGVFSCGQFFLKRNILNFTITDLGIGFRQNILRHIHLDFLAEEAIDWAMRDMNTTRRGDVPGGLGLKILREFIALNGGKLQVVSTNGFWEQQPDGHVAKRHMLHAFPGSIVNIEINSADQKSYILSSEKNTRNVF